ATASRRTEIARDVRAGSQSAPGPPREDTMSMKHIHVDFNTLTSAPVGLVKYLQEDGQPSLQEGERVLLYDADGLEVEASIVPYTTHGASLTGLRPPTRRPGATPFRRKPPCRRWKRASDARGMAHAACGGVMVSR